MDAQKRELRVRDGVYEVFYFTLCFCFQIVIVTSEGDDSHFDIYAIEAGNSVAKQSCAVDDESARNCLSICQYPCAGIFFLEADDIAGEKYFVVRVLLLYEVGKFVYYGDKVDYACAGDFYSGDACAIWFDLFDLGGVDFFQTIDTVLGAVVENAFEVGHFFFAGRDDDCAADFMGDAVLLRESDELFASVGAGSGLG